MRWITSLETDAWTAITADERRSASLARDFANHVRPHDKFVAGNWTDPTLLHGEKYDVVLADYLVGAVDRFAPYFQYDVLERLRPHVGERLYVVGLEPFDESDDSPGARTILEIARLRDACILHAGHRCHREYPLEWMLGALDRTGFVVEDAKSFPIVYGTKFIQGQLGVCEQKLEYIDDAALVRGLRHRIEEVRRRAIAVFHAQNGIRFGSDYVVLARPGS